MVQRPQARSDELGREAPWSDHDGRVPPNETTQMWSPPSAPSRPTTISRGRRWGLGVLAMAVVALIGLLGAMTVTTSPSARPVKWFRSWAAPATTAPTGATTGSPASIQSITSTVDPAAGDASTATGQRAYAIPINRALAIVDQIESGGSSGWVHVGATAFLGVEVLATGTDQGLGAASGPGAAVSAVLPGAPAASTALSPGDTITSIGGRNITSPQDLTALIGGHRPGDRVVITWIDASGTHRSATVTLEAGPAA